jgi:hypothetical protein
MGEIDLVDALALLLQDCALLQDDVLQVGGKQCEVFRGERGQKQIAPARTGAIQFHPQPFSSSEPKPRQSTALRQRARSAGGIGKPPARVLSVRYPTKMLRNEGLRGNARAASVQWAPGNSCGLNNAPLPIRFPGVKARSRAARKIFARRDHLCSRFNRSRISVSSVSCLVNAGAFGASDCMI